MMFVETSALNGTNIEDAFKTLTEYILEQQGSFIIPNKPEEPKAVEIEKKVVPEKTSCC